LYSLADSEMSVSAGTRLGPYEVLAPLGAGGMGEVYRARDTRLERTVAIKLLPEGATPDSDARRRFAAEARTISALNDPHIVAIYDIGVENQREFIVMECVEGETLRDFLGAGGIEIRQALEFGAQVAAGLASAHGAGIIHRDIKPENLMVTRGSQVKILDFGLAKLEEKESVPLLASGERTAAASASGERFETARGMILGTVSYMSPEQAAGRPLDNRTDIFSLGAVLYELLTGHRPFSGDSAVEVLHAIINDEPRPPLEWNRRLPREAMEVLEKAMAKDPADRYRHAGDLELDLRRAKRASESRAVSGAVAPPRAARPRRRVLGWTAAGLCLLAAAAAGWWLGRSRAQPGEPSTLGEATLTPLTTDPGYEGEPTFSPDGQTIAYVADREGNLEIYLQQISGGPALNLTRNAAADIQPSFSPDGREIAFVSDRSGGSTIMHAAPDLPHVGGDIWIMPALGGPARRIVENAYCPSWTPDGSGLLYVHGTFRDAHIARVPSSGGESRDLVIDEPNDLRYFFPSLSEDGRWLLYQNGNEVEVVAANGGKPRVLAQGGYPAWGRGSASILFTSEKPGKGRSLWQADFSLARGELAGPPRPLTFGRGADLGARASRDGSAIAFSSVNDTLNLEELPFDAESGRATGQPAELTRGNNHVGFFDPSRDGTAVVFGERRGESSHIWRIDPPSPPLQLTRDPGYSDGDPLWSPDGRLVAFSRARAGESEASQVLWTMNPDGTSPRRVTETSGETAWLPDGKTVLVHRGDALMRVDIESGALTRVAGAKVRTLLAVDESGKWIAYQVSEGGPVGIAVIPVAGGSPRTIVTAPFEANHPFFSPSGRWLYFQPDHKNLYRVPGPAQDWRTAAPEKVTDFSGLDLYIEDPKISRDGKKLFYTRGRRTGDILILRLSPPAQKKSPA
jgi:Tol biopolymer transport system component